MPAELAALQGKHGDDFALIVLRQVGSATFAASNLPMMLGAQSPCKHFEHGRILLLQPPSPRFMYLPFHQVLWDLLVAAGRHSEALRQIALVHEAVKAAFGAGSTEQRMMDVRLGMSIAGAVVWR